VLRYLGRYTHRVAISNHRLISFADQKVTFRWRDSAHKNEQRQMTLSLDEFLRRFLLHLLPDGFVRIRHFGFLANRKRAINLPLCFQLLGAAVTPSTEQDKSGAGNASDLWLCPKCAGPMVDMARNRLEQTNRLLPNRRIERHGLFDRLGRRLGSAHHFDQRNDVWGIGYMSDHTTFGTPAR
jgi:hypothetical protein